MQIKTILAVFICFSILGISIFYVSQGITLENSQGCADNPGWNICTSVKGQDFGISVFASFLIITTLFLTKKLEAIKVEPEHPDSSITEGEQDNVIP